MINIILKLIFYILILHPVYANDDLQVERDKIKSERNSLAIGWRDNLTFPLPKPGSYKQIGKATD